MKYLSVGVMSNDIDKDITICLEIDCEQIIVSPNQSFELFIEDIAEALPATFCYFTSGIQIYPHRIYPEWLIVFNGKEIKPSYPTILK